jgi:hypothetical protein
MDVAVVTLRRHEVCEKNQAGRASTPNPAPTERGERVSMTASVPATRAVGATQWVVADGWIPPRSSGPQPEMYSHDSLNILNAGPEPADIDLLIFFTDRDPFGPYQIRVEAQRSMHLAMNSLDDPEPFPHDVDFSVLITSSVPIVVQHTRVDTRQSELAVSSTMAYPIAT